MECTQLAVSVQWSACTQYTLQGTGKMSNWFIKAAAVMGNYLLFPVEQMVS